MLHVVFCETADATTQVGLIQLPVNKMLAGLNQHRQPREPNPTQQHNYVTSGRGHIRREEI